MVVGDGVLPLLAQSVDFFVLGLLQLQQDVLPGLELPLLLGELLLFQLNLDGFVLEHVALELGHLDLSALKLVLSLAEGALHDLSDVDRALLDPLQDSTELVLLVQLALQSVGFLL